MSAKVVLIVVYSKYMYVLLYEYFVIRIPNRACKNELERAVKNSYAFFWCLFNFRFVLFFSNFALKKLTNDQQ